MNTETSEEIFINLTPKDGKLGKCEINNCSENIKKTYIEVISLNCENTNDINCEKNINTWMNNYVNGDGYWPGQTSTEKPVKSKVDIYLNLKIFIVILSVLFLIFILSIISFLVLNKKMKM
jgi:hypothetical protein